MKGKGEQMNNMKERMEVNGTGGGNESTLIIKKTVEHLMQMRAVEIKTADDPEKKKAEIDLLIQETSQESMKKYDSMSTGQLMFEMLLEAATKNPAKLKEMMED